MDFLQAQVIVELRFVTGRIPPDDRSSRRRLDAPGFALLERPRYKGEEDQSEFSRLSFLPSYLYDRSLSHSCFTIAVPSFSKLGKQREV